MAGLALAALTAAVAAYHWYRCLAGDDDGNEPEAATLPKPAPTTGFGRF